MGSPTELDYGGLTVVTKNIKIGATGPGQAGTDISTTELGFIDGVTAGTAAASKALVLGASSEIATITSATITTLTGTTANVPTVNATNVDAGASGTAGSYDVFPTTASKGKTTFTASDNTGNTTTTINTAAQATTRTYTVPDAGASASFVMTAGQNTFAAGTATVAPIVLTAGTNLTTAAAGAIEFDGNSFYTTNHASARQVLNAEQYTIATSDSATYNNTALDTAVAAPVFTSTMGGSANGAVTLTAGKTYVFEACYILTNTGTTSHTWATLFGGTASFTSLLYNIYGLSATASTPATGGLTGYATVGTAIVATAASTSATENVTIMLNGTMTINAGGTLIPQLQASARPGATGTPGVVVKKGTFFRIWEMAGTGTVGNWS